LNQLQHFKIVIYQIMGKIDFFLNNKDWYDRKGIPYNLGIMLYGEPGCGKSMCIIYINIYKYKD